MVWLGNALQKERETFHNVILFWWEMNVEHHFSLHWNKDPTAQLEHEATTSKIGEDQISTVNQRGIDTEKQLR